MTYVAVQDLKRSRTLWDRLAREHELVVTRDGKPCAILIGVVPENVEDSLTEIRRSLFSTAVSRARQAAVRRPIPPAAIETAIRQSRQARGMT
jgi:hypothetical protein